MDIHSLSHFLQIWAFPPGLILLLMLMGGLLLRFRWRAGKYALLLSFILLWLLSTPIVTQKLINPLQQTYPPLASSSLSSAQLQNGAIIILGSGIENAPEYANHHTLSEKSLARLHYAAYLSQQLQVPVIPSGGNKDNSAKTEADLMREILTNYYHIPVLISENKSRDTHEEARNLVQLLKERPLNTLIIVTHAWHMPRSMYTFKQAFKDTSMQLIPAPMGYITLQAGDAWSDYLPQLSALMNSVYALHEYVGILWYRLFY